MGVHFAGISCEQREEQANVVNKINRMVDFMLNDFGRGVINKNPGYKKKIGLKKKRYLLRHQVQTRQAGRCF